MLFLCLVPTMLHLQDIAVHTIGRFVMGKMHTLGHFVMGKMLALARASQGSDTKHTPTPNAPIIQLHPWLQLHRQRCRHGLLDMKNIQLRMQQLGGSQAASTAACWDRTVADTCSAMICYKCMHAQSCSSAPPAASHVRQSHHRGSTSLSQCLSTCS